MSCGTVNSGYYQSLTTIVVVVVVVAWLNRDVVILSPVRVFVLYYDTSEMEIEYDVECN
jgi:hypothetical protein